MNLIALRMKTYLDHTTTIQVSCSILIRQKMTGIETMIIYSTKLSRLKMSPLRKLRSKKRRHRGKKWVEYSSMMHMQRCSVAKRSNNTSSRMSLPKYKQISCLLSKNLKRFSRICSQTKQELEISQGTRTRISSEIFLAFYLKGIISI